MYIKLQRILPVCTFATFVFWITGSTGIFIPNLTQGCYTCLCHISTKCDLSNDCKADYCGPFNISREYWWESGRITLPDDDPERADAWKDCARSYECAKRIIESFLQKFGKDCNGDGVTDCYDYMMVNSNGGEDCSARLSRTESGRLLLQRYEDCAKALE